MKWGLNGKDCPDKWVEAHGYDWVYDETNNILYWCTNFQCAKEEKLHNKKLNITWLSTEFFYDLLREVSSH
jgi:hypothetical protein